jgi:hypothetical protein
MDVGDRLLGFYRAKVIGNKDTEFFGRVVVWIPQIMPEVTEENAGLLARPANNPIGGRNENDDPEHQFMGTCYIPKNGSWVWVFFEAGNINKPYYFAACDLENAKVLPECQLGNDHEDKWVIFKSHDGRCIVISDDPDDARVEITGKKHMIKEPPSGDTDSVYTITNNQNTILLDERPGTDGAYANEKILIKSRFGDYINFDIKNKTLNIEMAGDLKIKAKNIHIEATGDLKIKASQILQEAATGIQRKAGANINDQANGSMNLKSIKNTAIQSAGPVTIDGSVVSENSGGFAALASGVTPDKPSGER